MAGLESNAGQIVISYRSQQFGIELEPLEVEERSGSVFLELRVTSNAAWQSFRWMSQAWFMYNDLDKFGQALRSGQEATLIDVGSYPVLRIVTAGGHARVSINPKGSRQSPDGERLTVEIETELDLPGNLAQAFRDFPKWW